MRGGESERKRMREKRKRKQKRRRTTTSKWQEANRLGSVRRVLREGGEEERRERKEKRQNVKKHAPKDDLARERADQRDARDREVDVGRQLAVVVWEVDDADGRLGEADDEEVVGVGEEADPGDEDGLESFFVLGF